MNKTLSEQVLDGTCTSWRIHVIGRVDHKGRYEYRAGTVYAIWEEGSERLVTYGPNPDEARNKMQIALYAREVGKDWKELPHPQIIQLVQNYPDSARFRKNDGTELIVLTQQFGPLVHLGGFYRWNGLFDTPEFQPVDVEWKVKTC